ncbi:MAG: DUF975 family protein [Clostridiales bacterium]|nr:DUF975 family protein [Clostridiales bacterium]
MFDRKVLKDRAKITLSRSYFMILIACVIVNTVSTIGAGIMSGRIQDLNFSSMSYIRILAVFAVISLLGLIMLAVSIFITAPLNVGLKYFMLQNELGDSRLDNLLFPFRTEYKNITFTLFMKNLYIFLWSLLGLIPISIALWQFGLFDKLTVLVQQINRESIKAALSLSGVMLVLLLFTLIFSIPAIIKELQYSMVSYILADDPDIEWKVAISRSKEMMVGNKWAYVKLIISFLPWYIIANLFCCIGSMLLTPYIEETLAQLYLELNGKGEF